MAQTDGAPKLEEYALVATAWAIPQRKHADTDLARGDVGAQEFPASLNSSSKAVRDDISLGASPADSHDRPSRPRWRSEGHIRCHPTRVPELRQAEAQTGDDQARRPSITFHPQVILDDGNMKGIKEPASRSRGRSMMQELAVSEELHTRTRTHSESDRSKYDPVTGEPMPTRLNGRKDGQYDKGQSRWPLLQITVDELAKNHSPETEEASERLPSLTSGSTASPPSIPVDSPHYPTGNYMLSPISTSSPTVEFPSLNDSGTLPSPRPRDAQRAKSYHIDRTRAMRNEGRRSSARSGSSIKSSASAFLSRWSRGSSVSAPEPDEDGQTIGHRDEYVIGRQVGHGGFSVVKEAFTIENGQQVLRAVKIVRKRCPSKSEEENEKLQIEYEHEVSTWRYLKHGNILPLLSVFETPFATFCITLMNTGGTLFDLVQSRRKRSSRSEAPVLPTPNGNGIDNGGINGNTKSHIDAAIPIPVVRRYLAQLAEAIRYLHEDMHIVHRDIKLENCLVTNPNCSVEDGELGNILLCDFGMADFVSQDDRDDGLFANNFDGSQEQMDDNESSTIIGPAGTSTNVQGSLQYASPELLKASRPLYHPAVDMWAYGVVGYALLTAQLPFTHSFLPKLQMMILKGEWNLKVLEAAVDKGSEEYGDARCAIQLVAKCLTLDVMSRWAIQDVLGCEFLGLPESFHAAFQSNLPRVRV